MNYSFKATYNCSEENKIINLINSLYLNDIIEITFNNESVPVSSTYTCTNTDNHTLYFLMKNPSTSMRQMFSSLKDLLSIYFSSKYNTENVIEMSSLFEYCSSLISANLSNLNTTKVFNMDYLFYSCHKIKIS